jgi:hypothetical protein
VLAKTFLVRNRLRNFSRIKYTDEKINQLVFELYGLGEEGREIILKIDF